MCLFGLGVLVCPFKLEFKYGEIKKHKLKKYILMFYTTFNIVFFLDAQKFVMLTQIDIILILILAINHKYDSIPINML